ncbi:MAG: hypothetical protein OEM77_03465 [Nitrosopumilus sp.]|nr:hypothetical protein [Nitrosopumilus sp.]
MINGLTFRKMTKWKKDAKEFIVSVNYNDARGSQCNIPKPILEFLGEPDRLKFVISGKSVKIKSEP